MAAGRLGALQVQKHRARNRHTLETVSGQSHAILPVTLKSSWPVLRNPFDKIVVWIVNGLSQGIAVLCATAEEAGVFG